MVYNYLHQIINYTFLSVGSELDTGYALFWFSATWRKFYCLQIIIIIMMCPTVPDPCVVVARNELTCI